MAIVPSYGKIKAATEDVQINVYILINLYLQKGSKTGCGLQTIILSTTAIKTLGGLHSVELILKIYQLC